MAFPHKGGDDRLSAGPYGSTVFRTAYEGAVAGAKAPIERGSATHGSFAWLIEQYLRSTRYGDLLQGRRRCLRGLLDWIRELVGKLPFPRMTVHNVEQLMARKTGPVAANNVKKTLSLLFNYAIRHELCGQKLNPATLADRRKKNRDGFYTWTDVDIAKFLDHHEQSTKARRALMIFLRTGTARQDAAAMSWKDLKSGRITYRRGKTGVEADLPILADLAEALAFVSRGEVLFLTHGNGLPHKPETLGMWFKDQCVAAGLDHCTAHGLRKAGAVQLANSGGTELEVMAFLAHSTPKEGATYTNRASRSGRGDSGLSKVSDAQNARVVSNHPPRLAKKGSPFISQPGHLNRCTLPLFDA